MPRDDEFEDEPQEPEYADWESREEVTKKILGVLKVMTVHEALLSLVAACDVLLRQARRDWDTTKVKAVLTQL